MNPEISKQTISMQAQSETAVALEAGRKRALGAKDSPYPRGLPYIVLRDADGAEHIEYLDGVQETPDDKIGTFVAHDLASFLAYYDEHKVDASRIYAEMKGDTGAVTFTGVIDEHATGNGLPAWREHRVVYVPEVSREWKTWTGKNRHKFSGNIEFAEWLEDNLPDVIDPAADTFMQLATSFRASENRSYSNETDLSNGRVALAYKAVVDGAGQTSDGGRIEIPKTFTICIPVFHGVGNVSKYNITARFRYRMGSPLSIWFDLERPHKVLENAFVEMVDEIRGRFSSKERALYFGSPKR